MITIDALRVSDGERCLLGGVTMHLTTGAVHGIAGEGRGTLLAALYGLVKPEAGSISASGHPLRRRAMAYLEADPQFMPGLTARDYVDLVRHYAPASDPGPLLRRLPVTLGTQAVKLPPAERKRLGLVLTLMRRKPLVLLDEPFRGLDVESLFNLQHLILHLSAEGRTFIVASQTLTPLDGISDDLYVLGGGVVRRRYEHYEISRAIRETGSPE